MSMVFSETSLNEAADALGITEVRLHSADPEGDGKNELVIGTYQRQSAVFNVSALGVRTLASDVSFNLDAGTTVAWITYWHAGTFKASLGLASATYPTESVFTVEAANTKLSVVPHG